MAVGFSPYYQPPMPNVAVIMRGPSPLQPFRMETGERGSASDMDTLKAQILAARNPGEVTQAIASASFSPRAAAFTSLIQLVGTGRRLSLGSLGVPGRCKT